MLRIAAYLRTFQYWRIHCFVGALAESCFFFYYQ